MQIQLRMYFEIILASTEWVIKCFRRLCCVILALRALTSKKLRDFHSAFQNQKRSSTKAGFWLSEPRSRHPVLYNEQINITKRQLLTLSSPLSASCHKETAPHAVQSAIRHMSQRDSSSRCPVRYPPQVTKTASHAVQFAIRHMSQRQLLTLSSPLSATCHKDSSSRCPIRYTPDVTKTAPHAVQSAIRHLLATPVNCLREHR